MGWVNKKSGIKKYNEGNKVEKTKKTTAENVTETILAAANPIDYLTKTAYEIYRKKHPKKETKKKTEKKLGGTHKRALVK